MTNEVNNLTDLLNTLLSEIMNAPLQKSREDFQNAREFLAHKTGHRDARHAAAELVVEFASKLAGGLK